MSPSPDHGSGQTTVRTAYVGYKHDNTDYNPQVWIDWNTRIDLATTDTGLDSPESKRGMQGEAIFYEQGGYLLTSRTKVGNYYYDTIAFEPIVKESALGIFLAIDTANIGEPDIPDNALRTRAALGHITLGNISVSNYPWERVDGIQIATHTRGDDVILPYGTGNIDAIIDNERFETIVDRGSTLVKIGDGNDVVIGGYGTDLFASVESAVIIPDATGTKFFVGGSNNDNLYGGRESDLLVGDRWGGHELYLTSESLHDVPAKWLKQANNLKAYQPPDFKEGAGSSLLGQYNDSLKLFSVDYYPLWAPGNDDIIGNDGDDVIYGDDNTINHNLYQLPTIRKWLPYTPYAVWNSGGGVSSSNWTSIKLGADEIDGGPGNDQIYGGVGRDAIIGGYGFDIIDIGPQIVVPGYEPFYGLKVVYGDKSAAQLTSSRPLRGGRSLETTTNDPDNNGVNMFIAGGLYDNEDELKQSNSGLLDTASASRQTLAEKMSGFEQAWQKIGKVVKLMGDLGNWVESIVGVTLDFIKDSEREPVALGTEPKAADALTIIKDFNTDDFLTLSVPKGETITIEKISKFTIGGSSTLNPLAGDIIESSGTMIYQGKGAGNNFQRIFLQGYNEELNLLGYSADQITFIYGGNDYAEFVKNPVAQQSLTTI